MLKSHLIRRISSRNPHLYQRDVEKVLNAILDQIVRALARGDRVELRGFGVFSTKLRKARTGRNPRTGVAVSVAQKAMLSFKAAKEMQKRLNQEAAQVD
jgi:integration host factor subunit beta